MVIPGILSIVLMVLVVIGIVVDLGLKKGDLLLKVSVALAVILMLAGVA